MSSVYAGLSWMLLWGTLPPGKAVDDGQLTETGTGEDFWQTRVWIERAMEHVRCLQTDCLAAWPR